MPRRPSPNLPRGSSFGTQPRNQPPTILDYESIAATGSRAQRRYAEKMIRRQLKEAQRAMAAARLANLEHGSNQYGKKVELQICSSTFTVEQAAADVLQVSPSSAETRRQ